VVIVTDRRERLSTARADHAVVGQGNDPHETVGPYSNYAA
jgi:hypothetical protein